MRLAFSSGRARLKLWADFCSPIECEEIIALARPKLQPSTVLDRATGASVPSTVRTSEGAYFRKDECELLASLTTRAAGLLGVPRDNLEPLQVIRYGVGAKYEPHNDWFDLNDPGSAGVLAQGGQRTKTLLIYLNTPQQGGATRFPEADCQVEAHSGDAVQFEYPTASPADLCLHGGDPVLAGEKWAINVWVRERAFGFVAPQPPPVSDSIAQDWIFNADDCATLRAFYDARADRAENGVDRVVRIASGELQPFVDRVKERVDRFFPEPKQVETVVLACMPAGVAMENHADNVRWDGLKFVPNHTPNRTHTAVTFLQDGEGGVTHYGDSPTPGFQLDVPQRLGHAHMHRCGPDNYHRVSASQAPRYTFVVWFKKPTQ